MGGCASVAIDCLRERVRLRPFRPRPEQAQVAHALLALSKTHALTHNLPTPPRRGGARAAETFASRAPARAPSRLGSIRGRAPECPPRFSNSCRDSGITVREGGLC